MSDKICTSWKCTLFLNVPARKLLAAARSSISRPRIMNNLIVYIAVLSRIFLSRVYNKTVTLALHHIALNVKFCPTHYHRTKSTVSITKLQSVTPEIFIVASAHNLFRSRIIYSVTFPFKVQRLPPFCRKHSQLYFLAAIVPWEQRWPIYPMNL